MSGAGAERRAAWFYRLRGYRILARNVWLGGNELDLVARRGSRVVFCEVKEKLGESYGDPVEMVGPEKRCRLARAAEAWLAAHPEHGGLECTFDVIAVRGSNLERVANAFSAP